MEREGICKKNLRRDNGGYMTKLFLGCGPFPIHPQHLEVVDDSWTFVDKYVENPKIVKMDIQKLEYPDNSVERIYCSHTLEHIGSKEVIPCLKEWYRVLKSGGDVIINVPDMEWAAEELINLIQGKNPRSPVFNTQEKIMEIIYGNQDHEGEFHKSGYTSVSLAHFLQDAGFKEIKVKQVYEAHEMGCVIARGYK